MQSPGAIANFMILSTLVNLSRQLIIPFSNSLGVELSRLHASGTNAAEIGQYLWRSTRLMCVANGSVLAALFWLAEPFVRIWSGDRVVMDYYVATALGAGFLLTGPFVIIANYLNFIGDATIGAASRIAQTIIALVVGLACVRAFGVLGVALGLAAGEALGVAPFFLRKSAQWMAVTPARLCTVMFAYTLAGLAPVMAVGFAVRSVSPTSLWLTFGSHVVVLAVAVAATVFIFALSPADRARAWRITRGLVSRPAA
jgi:O-antigen/teichoic acid export membrane protein